jgi:hypothetical protein
MVKGGGAMLRFLQSLFGTVERGRYPESLVGEAIERAVDGTDPWLRGVSGYKTKLRPAVLRAIDHVVALVEMLPPPLSAGVACYDDDPRLKAFFMSRSEMRKVYGGDRNLTEFRKNSGSAFPQIFALLTMQKREGVTLGAELSGEIIMRDVPRATVTFESHRLFEPTADERETRRQLMRRAYDYLLGMALRRIAQVKSERQDLERRRTLLEAKLNLLMRGGWGFDEVAAAEGFTVAALEEKLGEIEEQLLKLGKNDGMLDVYLDIVVEVLGQPEKQIWSRQETLIVDRLGIKRSEPACDAPELTLHELWSIRGESLVAMLVALPGEDLREVA